METGTILGCCSAAPWMEVAMDAGCCFCRWLLWTVFIIFLHPYLEVLGTSRECPQGQLLQVHMPPGYITCCYPRMCGVVQQVAPCKINGTWDTCQMCGAFQNQSVRTSFTMERHTDWPLDRNCKSVNNLDRHRDFKHERTKLCLWNIEQGKKFDPPESHVFNPHIYKVCCFDTQHIYASILLCFVHSITNYSCNYLIKVNDYTSMTMLMPPLATALETTGEGEIQYGGLTCFCGVRITVFRVILIVWFEWMFKWGISDENKEKDQRLNVYGNAHATIGNNSRDNGRRSSPIWRIDMFSQGPE